MPETLQGDSLSTVHRIAGDRTLASAQAGDESAFEQLMAHHSPALIRFAAQVLGGDEEGAESVVQDAWLRAWDDLGTFESRDHLVRWLFTVARCRAISVLRKRKRMRYGSWQDEPGEEPGFASPAAPAIEPRHPEHAEAVNEAVASLPDAYRGPATLFYLHGQSVAQVALLLDLTRGTVKMRLHRARDWLRRRLNACVSE